jgi:membrane protein implicated in regulation of membrane protease activity
VTKIVSAACFALVVLLAGSACSRQPAPSSTAAPATSAPAAAAPGNPGAIPVVTPGTGGQQALETVTGEVVETMDALTYTYVRVKTAKGDVWAATGKTKVAVGDKVVVPLESEMRNFHSPSLNRDFPVIYFVSQITREGEPTPPPMALGHGMGSGSASPQAPVKVDPIAPPAGGSSIADVWANRASLAGKSVTVSGKVVKFNGGILGRNWLHVQDGSGKAADGTNELTVTTDAMTKVGDVITATGTVVVNKDFGAGYAYKVMLEGAKIR